MYSRLPSPRISPGANIEHTNSYHRISNNYMIYIHYKILYIRVKPEYDEGSSLQKIIKLQKIIYLIYSI